MSVNNITIIQNRQGDSLNYPLPTEHRKISFVFVQISNFLSQLADKCVNVNFKSNFLIQPDTKMFILQDPLNIVSIQGGNMQTIVQNISGSREKHIFSLF